MPMTEHAATARTPDPAADLQACVALMRTGSRSFFAASRLLPSRVRPASIALYAFCRVADDIVDEAGLAPAESRSLLAGRLDAIYAGCPGPAVEDRALAAVVRQYDLPRPWLDALLDGFAWDAAGRTYETLEEVHDYGARVAGSVGAMMCWIMGVRDPQALARACEMGVAMQLTNIARDVGEDARNGRLYLPRQWLQAEGIDAVGPVPGDALFMPRARASYDAALAMYHDQALIPIKALEVDEGVNVTLGLPIIRTSPDHGTAFDIAGQGKADPGAMAAAIVMAAQMAAARAAAGA